MNKTTVCDAVYSAKPLSNPLFQNPLQLNIEFRVLGSQKLNSTNFKYNVKIRFVNDILGPS